MNVQAVHRTRLSNKHKKTKGVNMKKSCLVALGALVACIGAANAASLKDTCLANPSKFVWDESFQDCVPINPCLQPETSDYYKVYCVESDGFMFTNNPAGNNYFAEAIVNYKNRAWRQDYVCTGNNADPTWYLVSCKYDGGKSFVQYRFSKKSGFKEIDDEMTARTLLCNMLGGKLVETTVC